MKKTWRWFGKKDPVSLTQLKVLGVEGIVSALHHIPNGKIWPKEEILSHKSKIEAAGLQWSVVESLPVSEGIKIRGKNWDQLIHSYCESLKNLAECGIHTVCYNFMPVLDWVRTDLHYSLPTGGISMAFDPITFATFDLHILKRPRAESQYKPALLAAAEKKISQMSLAEQEALAYSIIVHTQAFIDGAVDPSERHYKEKFLEYVLQYQDTGKGQLRENLVAFLQEIFPTAARNNIHMAIHPDDPPFSVLGLPRIISNQADLEYLFEAVPHLTNGLTFCSGSLGARPDNDLSQIFSLYASRIHFVHLRNIQFTGEQGFFYESGHLEGQVDMAHLVQLILQEEYRRKEEGQEDWLIPMRPDHGVELLDDDQRKHPPGYPLMGRMKGLAELRGLEAGLRGR
ncbi:MAG: mannonate dehydratase [Bacteroidota bacterium]